MIGTDAFIADDNYWNTAMRTYHICDRPEDLPQTVTPSGTHDDHVAVGFLRSTNNRISR